MTDPLGQIQGEPYDTRYADLYEEVFQDNLRWEAETRHHLEILAELVRPGTKWLDVACGTGYFLSQFPGVERAGLDRSADMLRHARAKNPDALLREGDMRDEIAEWRDAWTLVTCTGTPWCYLNSMGEVETFAENLARWTAPDGVCFMPLHDIVDHLGIRVDYCFDDRLPPPGVARLDAIVCSIFESGVLHRHTIWPSVDVWVRLFARHFRRVELRRFPHEPVTDTVAQRVLVVSGKRQSGETDPAEIIVQPAPPTEQLAEPPPERRSPMRRLLRRLSGSR